MERFVGYSAKNRVREDLPPPNVWRHDPRSTVETPLDERGLVDFPELIKVVRESVEPGYRWPSPYNDRHHLQWPRRYYPEVQRRFDNEDVSPYEFRNLGIGLVRVPRYWHNWVHLITEPPPVPREEVMKYRIEAQRVALSLFERVAAPRRQARRMGLSRVALEEYHREQLELRFEDFAERYELAAQQPVEFHPINYSEHDVRGIDDMILVAKVMGREAINRTAVRLIREPALS